MATTPVMFPESVKLTG